MRTIMAKVKFPCSVDFFTEVCLAAAKHLPPECRGGRAVVGETDADGFTPIYATTDKKEEIK